MCKGSRVTDRRTGPGTQLRCYRAELPRAAAAAAAATDNSRRGAAAWRGVVGPLSNGLRPSAALHACLPACLITTLHTHCLSVCPVGAHPCSILHSQQQQQQQQQQSCSAARAVCVRCTLLPALTDIHSQHSQHSPLTVHRLSLYRRRSKLTNGTRQ